MFILNKSSLDRKRPSQESSAFSQSVAQTNFSRAHRFIRQVIRAFNRNVYPALGLSLLFTGYFFFQIHRLVVDEELLDHSDRAIGQAVLLQKLMLDAETGVRGFLLTDADVTLNPFREQSAVFGEALRDALNSVKDNSAQASQLDIVKNQFGIWVAQAQRLIVEPIKNRSTKDRANISAFKLSAAKEYFGLGEGRLVMDRCRNAINIFLINEQKLRDQRAVTLRREIPRAIASGAAATLVLRVIGVLILHRIRKSKDQMSNKERLGNPE